ncbi:MAG TPA: flagellar protein export ATPase FliI [Rhizomicrobium sp.]|jgi:flagellum-specific ATP synthase|nr:flagellar protein export ATPase FliI [Rhizomicrobium sp.]
MQALIKDIEAIPTLYRFGRVARIEGLAVEITGAQGAVSLGGQCRITIGNNKKIPCEVVGFRDGRALVMPMGPLEGITLGARADFEDRPAEIFPCTAWLGRVVDGFAQPIDGKGALVQGRTAYAIKAPPPPATLRGRVGKKLDLGIRALNTFATCCAGQRMGIFSGSGVGKSILLSMLAKNSNADAIVIGLIGERGREVKEFIEDDLGEEGLARSVVVAATSDEAPLVRRQAAYVAMAVAEQLRDSGLNVLLLMDSITRFAMAQREIGLSAGEPPASKGYTPTVFAELPRLLERAGPGLAGGGTITGLFTVLVEGDDHNEPVADAVRGILDGHIVLERAIAERGRFPAINILKSVSRAMPGCNSEAEQKLVLQARAPLTIYEDMAELIRLGAYKAGTNPEVDEAVRLYPQLEAFLAQSKDERATFSQGYNALSTIMGSAQGSAR